MKVLTFEPEIPYGSNTHVIISHGEAIVVDPSIGYPKLAAALTEPVVIKSVLLTHAHFDHFLEIESYSEKKIPVFVGSADAVALGNSRLNCYMQFSHRDIGFFGEATELSEGDKITVGGEELTVMETPGHTPGSISLYHDKILISGDLIFLGGGFGRYDLPGGDYGALIESLGRISRLPAETKVYTGHVASTYI